MNELFYLSLLNTIGTSVIITYPELNDGAYSRKLKTINTKYLPIMFRVSRDKMLSQFKSLTTDVATYTICSVKLSKQTGAIF